MQGVGHFGPAHACLIKRLELGVRAVTQRRFIRCLTSTEEHFFAFFGGEFHGRHIRFFVRSVAIGLICRMPAGTPEIGFSGLDIDGIGGFLCDLWSGHVLLPFNVAFGGAFTGA